MKKLNQKGFHILPILMAIVVVGAIAFVGIKVFKNKDKNTGNPDQNNNSLSFADQYKDVCEDRDVNFTSPPLKMEQLGYIRPLGAMLDGHVTPTDHVYVGSTDSQAADNTVPVIMPANGTIVEIARMPDQYIGDRAGTQVAPEDHRLVISFSCRYFSIFIHIHKLSDKLASQVAGQQANESKRVAIDLNAGDTVGYIGGSTFDWTPIDAKSELKGFLNKQLYQGESWKINTVSPFDLYKGSLKSQLEAKSLRTVAPIGGKIDYDQAGKLVGNWFREGTNGYAGAQQDRYWDGHLAVVPDYIDPSYTIVSIGNWEGSAAQFLVTGSADPAKISSGSGMVKYELVKYNYGSSNGSSWNGSIFVKGLHPVASGAVVGTIAFEVQPGEKLKVEKFPGKTAAQVSGFTSAAQTYER